MTIKKCLAAVIVFALAGSARAGDYTFEIPQLVGNYLGDIPAIPTIDVIVDLGIDFAEIESASLQLSGTHTLGRMGDLNSDRTFSLPAEIIARSDRPGIYSDVYVDALLPSQNGSFEFDETFRVGHFAGEPPDFSPWQDGTAEFQFTVATPPTIAIYYLIDMPSVTIDSARLVIQGQPNLDAFMLRGDFDGDGDVDSSDLTKWQQSYGSPGGMSGRDFLEWQRQYGGGVEPPSAVVAVPEPNSLFLLFGLCLVCPRRSR